jgi:hypothetical protein
MRNDLIPKYKGLRSYEALNKMVAEASDNGRCWWIETYLRYNLPNYKLVRNKDRVLCTQE